MKDVPMEGDLSGRAGTTPMSVTIDDRLDGRRALVTGGSKGTGAAIVARLIEAGATVMTTARNVPENYSRPDLFVGADVGPKARGATSDQAATACDLVVVAIPFRSVAQVPVQPLAGKVVIDVSNYYEEQAKGIVAALIDQIGFDTVDDR
jgi:predicted dinucleotide-binding enzyme